MSSAKKEEGKKKERALTVAQQSYSPGEEEKREGFKVISMKLV